ncbi:MAG: fibronectin type III domain-containing protein, partial [Patescibacteria group bacterium]
NELANSQINYGLTVGYGSSTTLDATLTTQHSVNLQNLTPNQTYHYQILSRDGNNNLATSGDLTFLTGTAIDTTPVLITNVTSTSIGLTYATIGWDTSKNSNATVDFGTTLSYGNLVGNLYDFSLSTHAINLTSLLGNTLYYYRVNSADSIGNNASSTGSFTTIADTTPPVISATSSLANSNAAYINWTTDELAFSEVNYGTSTNVLDTQVAITSTPRTIHSLPLTGLLASTTYYYNIVSTDQSLNATTVGPFSFDTPVFGMQTVVIDNTKSNIVIDNTKYPDVSLPIISNLQVTEITPFSASVNWTTDKEGSSLVRYGQSNQYGSLAGNYISRVTNHIVALDNLSPRTTYHFIADTFDAIGNLGSSADTFFTTLNIDGTEAKPSDTPAVTPEEEKQKAARQFVVDQISKAPLNLLASMLEAFSQNPFLNQLSDENAGKTFAEIASQIGQAPTIVGLRPQVEVHGNSATVRWSTDKKTTGLVAFAKESDYAAGTDKPYTTSIVDGDALSSVHTVELASLESATRYHFQVASKGEVGPEARSKDYTFETEAILPTVADAKVTDTKATSAIVSWKTNVPTESTLEYTNIATKKSLTAGDPALLISHVFTLQSLDPGVKYSLIIKAKNESGQEQPSDPIYFETIIDKEVPQINNVTANSTLYPGATSKVQTIVSWDTNEPTISQVFYQEGVQDNPDNVKSTQLETSPAEKHFVVLTAFKPGSVYKYWVEATDLSGNKTQSDKFTTLTPVEKQTIIDLISNNFQSVFGWTKNVGL